MAGSILGSAVKRVEDPRFIRGEGQYLANLGPSDALSLTPVRSPIPHGKILSIDTARARAMPGVTGVYVASDLDLPPVSPGVRGVPKACSRPVIASDTVRFVGEIVAVVVARTEREAVDAAEAVWADIDPLPSVSDPEAALAEGAPLLFPEIETNQVLEGGNKNQDNVLTGAQIVVEAGIVNQRLAAVPMEANSALAVPDGAGIEVWVGSQNVFGHRAVIAKALGMDRSDLRVRTPDMGGGFGAKFYVYPEQILVVALAHKLGKAVRWHESRTENLVGMYQGRAQVQEVRLGARSDGTLVGWQARLTQDAGAYPAFGSYLPHWTEIMASGAYRIPAIDIRWRSVVTNTTPIHAYRGAGRPEATAMLERAMDLLAAKLGLDPAELRRRNFIDEFPYETPTGAVYDSGDYTKTLDRALELANYEGIRKEQVRRRHSADRLQLGIGVSTYVEITAPDDQGEWAGADVHEDGTVTVRCGTSGHGQGHETAYAQIVSELMRISVSDVRLVQADTGRVPRGSGTGGSRSLQLGGSAVLEAGKAVVDKAKRLVAHLNEANPADVVVFENGTVGVAGVPDTGVSWGELATMAADPDRLPSEEEPGLSAELDFEGNGASFPFGAHISVVEVDVETGDVRLLDHVAVDDCGTVVNPLLVAGQVHGGVAQGVGQALCEQVLHDEEGYPLTVNLTGYLIPTASTLPAITRDSTETPTPNNPLGAKGIGEAATIGSTPAVQNAVLDALAPFGVDHIDMPLTPAKVWAAISPPVGGSPAKPGGEGAGTERSSTNPVRT